MKRCAVFFGIIALITGFSLNALAHTLYMTVSDNEDGTVSVEGMFSTGSSASAVVVRIEDNSGNVLLKGRTNEDGEYSFKKPDIPYTVILDAGPGHEAREEGP